MKQETREIIGMSLGIAVILATALTLAWACSQGPKSLPNNRLFYDGRVWEEVTK